MDIPEKTPSSVNQPASGTYGEGADLARLKAQLPSPSAPIGSGPNTEPAPAPMGTTPPRPPDGGQSPIEGLPASLFTQPTTRPLEPGTAMPSNTPQPSTMTGQQQRIMILDALANDPSRSEETREWARMMIRILVG